MMLLHEAKQRFLAIEHELRCRYPDAILEAQRLSNQVKNPMALNIEDIWEILGTKPLYANTRTNIARSYVDKLAPLIANGRWRIWGDNIKPFISLAGPANRNASFSFTRHAPVELQCVGISRKRLFAVQGAAQALVDLQTQTKDQLAGMVDRKLEVLVPELIEKFGKGWGCITVLHFLTDMGIAVKPDIHLVRSVHTLQLLSGIRQRKQPTMSEALAMVEAVKGLVNEVYGEITPKRLRYVDKVLMAASQHHVVGVTK